MELWLIVWAFPCDIAKCFVGMSAEVLVKDYDAVALLFCNYPRAFVRANWKEALDSNSCLMHVRM